MPSDASVPVTSVLAEILRTAAESALNDPTEQLQNFLTDEVGDVKGTLDQALALPGDVLAKLQEQFENPDWGSLLVFALHELASLDPGHLRVGTAQPPGWSRMLTLGYLPDGAERPALVVGLALADQGVKRGFAVHAASPFPEQRFADDDKSFSMSLAVPTVDAPGAGAPAGATGANWEWAFGSGATAPEGRIALTVKLTWKPPGLPDKPIAGIRVGDFTLTVDLHGDSNAGGSDYRVTVEVAPAPDMQEAIEVHVHPGELIGPSDVLSIADIDEGFSAKVVVDDGASPRYTFTHRALR